MAKAADIVRRLAVILLMAATLTAPANARQIAASSAGAPQSTLAILDDLTAPPAAVPDGGPIVTADDGRKPPCDGSGILPGTARCLTSQCAPGGIPAASSTAPSPRSGADAHAAVSDSPPRGVTPVLDPPPPRPSA